MKQQFEIAWRPESDAQRHFLTCPVWELLFEGRRFSGKTDALLMDFVQHIGKGWGAHWRGILFRRTYPELVDVIAKSKRWFHLIFKRAKYNESTHTWTWPDGAQLLLRFMASPEDYWSYHGHEYPWIGWEELASWPDDRCYEVMKSCSRSSIPKMPRKYRSTTNPWGPGHRWVKRHFIDAIPQQGMVVRDEEGLTRAFITGQPIKKLALADPEYTARLKSIRDPELRRAWLEGAWDITVGGMFNDVFEKKIHVIRPFRVPPGWRVDRAFDWGSSAPFSVLWFAESNGEEAYFGKIYPRGTIFAIAELYGADAHEEGLKLTSREIAARVVSAEESIKRGLLSPGAVIHPGPADLNIWEVREGTCIADEMARAGVGWTRAAKGPGSRITGIAAIRDRLAASLMGEGAGLYFFDGCRWLATHLPELQRDTKDMEDIADGQPDHDTDTLRYRLTAKPPVIAQVGGLRF